MKSVVKKFLYSIGLYPVVRNFYRKLDATHRKEIRFNRDFLGKIVNKGDRCFDIGANVGQTTEVLLELGAKVVAVEPNVKCVPVFKYQFGVNNPNLDVIVKAVGASPGFANLNFSGTDSTASIRTDWPHPHDEVVRVEVVTLDQLIAEYGTPDFLKVDVEGFELEVFRGLSSPVPMICFEIHSNELDLVKQIFERLAGIGHLTGVKAVSGDNSKWICEDWVPVERFLSIVMETDFQYANVLVRMSV